MLSNPFIEFLNNFATGIFQWLRITIFGWFQINAMCTIVAFDMDYCQIVIFLNGQGSPLPRILWPICHNQMSHINISTSEVGICIITICPNWLSVTIHSEWVNAPLLIKFNIQDLGPHWSFFVICSLEPPHFSAGLVVPLPAVSIFIWGGISDEFRTITSNIHWLG